MKQENAKERNEVEQHGRTPFSVGVSNMHSDDKEYSKVELNTVLAQFNMYNIYAMHKRIPIQCLRSAIQNDRIEHPFPSSSRFQLTVRNDRMNTHENKQAAFDSFLLLFEACYRRV